MSDDLDEIRPSDITKANSQHASETPSELLTRSYQTCPVDLDWSDQPESEKPAMPPTAVAEFQIRTLLGRGGFGTVYLAYDQVLQREVALKIPYRPLVEQDLSADMYLREARAMASLDHPHILPVYRAASTPDIPCYIVTKLIRGCHLGMWTGRNQPPLEQLLRVLLSVADALSYAHKQGIVHRDIKPGNILLDLEDHPYVADFGLALRDIDLGAGPAYVGTAAYMSPEQAQGEGHRVDGRSDIFSFGVMLYELTTGKRPFTAKGQAELFQQILFCTPENPCQLNRQLPTELGRVCLKALAKSVSDRYQSIEQLAMDLQQVLNAQQGQHQTTSSELSTRAVGAARVIPKGLRPFDSHDADFFLQLLPGQRDREGLPEILQFWLTRIAPGSAAVQVPVGLIYGPSGCGKSSLVRAGIMPRIASPVASIYIACTAHDTEKLLVDQIAAAMPPALASMITEQTSVVEAFALVRRAKDRKLVIFVDQFEQWLFAHPECERQPLTQALRQCDGVHLQCILMVRDDFWMGISRLLQALDINIAEGVNMTAVDMFDVPHARKVLALFGAAYDRLPRAIEEISVGQTNFLNAAVDYLAKDGRVVCVQLALLTEMLKERTWEKPAGLFAQGGVGIGVRFLEETFDSEAATRRMAMHADGAHRVLRALLPEAGSRIKGSMRSEENLYQASGYRDRTAFGQLLVILDRELHLITPTDRLEDETLSGESHSTQQREAGYQLTHDFLIVPIRNWIEIRNRTSREGKAKLRLEEFSELYRARPRRQSLPTLAEFISMRRHVLPANWTAPQQQMMAAAQQLHVRSVGSALVVTLLVLTVILAINQWLAIRNTELTGRAAMQSLLNAPMDEAIKLAAELGSSPYVRNACQEKLTASQAAARERVRAALVLCEQSDALAILAQHVLIASEDEAIAIGSKFRFPHSIVSEVILPAWRDLTEDRRRQMRSACVLANQSQSPGTDPEVRNWLSNQEDRARLIRLLVSENPMWLNGWRAAFEPVADELLPLLTESLKDNSRTQASLNTVNLIVGFAGRDLQLLVDLLPYAHPPELTILTEAISRRGADGLSAVQQRTQQIEADSNSRANPTTPWGSPWWCLGKRQPIRVPLVSLPAHIRSRLDATSSLLTDCTILAQSLPAAQLESLTDDVEQAGYRVASLAPYYRQTELYFAALWVRDGARSVFRVNQSVDQLRTSQHQLRSAGFLPDSIAYLRDNQGNDRYCCVWIQPPEGADVLDADMYLDIHQDQHEQRGWRELQDRGLNFPRSALHVRKADNDHFSSIRWRLRQARDYSDVWNLDPSEFQQMVAFSKSVALLDGHQATRHDDQPAGINAIWWHNLPVESVLVASQSPEEHLQTAKQKLAEGFYPIGLHARSQPTNGPDLQGPDLQVPDLQGLGSGDRQPDTTLQLTSTWWRPLEESQRQLRQTQQLSRLAVAQFNLKAPQLVERALAGEISEEMRGALVSSFHDYDLPPNWLINQVLDPRAPTMLRRSCAHALALLNPESLGLGEKASFHQALSTLIRSASDPGVRSALMAVARAWKLEVDPSDLQPNANELKSSAGDRLVVVRPPPVVWLGSQENEPGRDETREPIFPVVLPSAYAISTHEVTIEQFRRFRPEHAIAENYATSLTCPVIDVTWFDAARYCRWLSEQEHIAEEQMCYPPLDEIVSGMELAPESYNRTGYRLPTEAEWEWACRGGAAKGRWFGFEPRLLDQYAWTAANSNYQTHPAGQLLPNDFGLFDTLGNAKEWTSSREMRYPLKCKKPYSDPGRAGLTVTNDTIMVTRGGAMLYQPMDARASHRDGQACDDVRVYMTFRIARTLGTH